MAHRTSRRVPGTENAARFAELLGQWVESYGVLLDALTELRHLGDEPVAVAALLDARPVRTLRLSWELWEALLDGDGEDTEATLEEVVEADVLGWCRSALWGARGLRVAENVAELDQSRTRKFTP